QPVRFDAADPVARFAPPAHLGRPANKAAPRVFCAYGQGSGTLIPAGRCHTILSSPTPAVCGRKPCPIHSEATPCKAGKQIIHGHATQTCSGGTVRAGEPTSLGPPVSCSVTAPRRPEDARRTGPGRQTRHARLLPRPEETARPWRT